jgi:hypothetical protein
MIASIVPCLSSAASSSVICTIARHGSQLAGEPPDFGALLGGQRQRLPALELALVHLDPFEFLAEHLQEPLLHLWPYLGWTLYRIPH